MAKKFVQMDGTIGDKPDVNWNQQEAKKRGLILSSGQINTVISATPAMSPALIMHIRDCQHAQMTGSNDSHD